MKAKHWLIIVLLAAIAGSIVWWTTRSPGPRIPALFVDSLPADCQQMLLVVSPEAESVQAQLWLMERNGSR